jgi:hypothetical protein
MTDNYNELSMGYPANISGMTSASRGFNRLMGYAESHDEERLMYKTCNTVTIQTAHNVKVMWLCQGCQLELFLYWFQDQK